ncbi:hypothetical protein OfM1_20250 [Lactovum odontotermitis]
MGMFSDLPQAKLKLRKKNGEEFDFSANLQTNRLFTDIQSIPFEDGDMIERILPTGVLEMYHIVDIGYKEEDGYGFPSHYQMKIEKSPKSESNTISFSGKQVTLDASNGGQINIQSGNNNSLNVVLTSDEENRFTELMTRIEKIEDNEDIYQKCLQMKNAVGTESFSEKYNQFIQTTANHMTIIAPFIPFLSSLLQR